MSVIVAYGEVMMRLNPDDFNRLDQSNNLEMSFTGTGLNVLAGLSRHGYETRLLSVLPDNRIGHVAKSHIRKHDIQDKSILLQGNHIGIYLLERGYEYRPTEVTYLDRAHSSFNTVTLDDETIERALKDASLLHICGIALSTSTISLNNVLNLVNKAKEKEIPICFDFNYRPSLNNDMDEDLLIATYETILREAEIVVGSIRDIKRFVDEDNFETVISEFSSKYEITRFIGTNKYEEHNEKYLQGYVYTNGELAVSDSYPIKSLDRVGTGDAFVSAYLAKLMKGDDERDCINYASCAAHLAYTTHGDIPVLDKSFIERYMQDKPDIIR